MIFGRVIRDVFIKWSLSYVFLKKRGYLNHYCSYFFNVFIMDPILHEPRPLSKLFHRFYQIFSSFESKFFFMISKNLFFDIYEEGSKPNINQNFSESESVAWKYFPMILKLNNSKITSSNYPKYSANKN